jgi:Rad3-related DNA helicase
MQTPLNPKDLGIPHDEWRPNQLALFEKVKQHKGEFIFGELGTGSGKTGIASGLGHKQKVLAVVHTLALLTQYEQNYGFSVVRGRQEYPCILEKKVDTWREKFMRLPTAADCHFSKMNECPVAGTCPYLLAKHKALRADRAACTYRYVGVSELMKSRTGHLVLDEAHDAVEELIRFNKFSVNNEVVGWYNLPPFPYAQFGEDNLGDILSPLQKYKIVDWLDQCLKIFAKYNDESPKASRAKNLYHRYNRMMESLYTIEWFLQIFDDKAIMMALNAEIIAREIFRHKNTKLLMSATIGDPAPLAKALGISEYQFFTFPHPIPSTFRQVHDLGLPRMTKRNLENNPTLYWKQVDAIIKWVSRFPHSWRGAIFTTSYYKIERLSSMIERFMPNRRYFVQEPGQKIADVVGAFVANRRPGDVMVGTIQGMGTGLDLFGDIARWVVIAGVPHPNPTDRYEKARRAQFGGQAYQNWVTYNSVPQACGRISRGETTEAGHINIIAIGFKVPSKSCLPNSLDKRLFSDIMGKS